MSGFQTLRVALVGAGTVGGATAAHLLEHRSVVAERSGIDIELVAVVDRNYDHARSLGIDQSVFQPDFEAVLADTSIHVVIELVGGLDFARTLIRRALDAGKHVVTANKALLAHHGEELFGYARSRGLVIGFEASCAGGIPIVRALTEGLIANRIDAIYGIVNGTCNYLLTEMIQRGASYEDALRDAQADGLAEADPSLDVNGTDSAHKIAIMTALAFGSRVTFDTIPVSGIDTLDAQDVAFGSRLGYTVKLLAVAERIDDDVAAWVRPAFIAHGHPLAWVSGPFNAVSVYGHATGHTMYYGRGAGGQPTASAVVSDLVAIAGGVLPSVFERTRYWPDKNTGPKQIGLSRSASRFYMRVRVQDQPGVMASITSALGSQGISIASLHQYEPEGETPDREKFVPVVIITHRCPEEALKRAANAIAGLAEVVSEPVYMPIVEEREEGLSG